MEIDMSRLKSGMYLVRVTIGEQIKTYKMDHHIHVKQLIMVIP